jgi:hypothetical protein
VAVGGSHRNPFAPGRAIAHWGWENRHFIYGEITLNGGDPRKLTLGAFVNAAYALMVRTYSAIPGKNLMEAIELANESFGIETEQQTLVEDKNEDSLKALENMMRGVK